MGNNKEGKVHVQGWLDTGDEDDVKAIEALEYFKGKGFSPRRIISIGLRAVYDYETSGTVTYQPERNEMELLRQLMAMVKKLSTKGFVIAEEDKQIIDEVDTLLDQETVNNLMGDTLTFD